MGAGTGAGQAGDRKLSWAVALLSLVAITSSSLSALSLYHVLALQAEVEGLRMEECRRREEQCGTPTQSLGGPQAQQQEQRDEEERLETLQKGNGVTPPNVLMDASGRQQELLMMRRRSVASEFQSCLQMMPDSKRQIFQKEFALEKHTGVPWQLGLKRGDALVEDQDTMLVKEEGYFYIYSQVEHYDPPVTEVFYRDSTFAMGHIIVRVKKNMVGDERQHVVLFRCVQSMDLKVPYNTCYTGGVVRLEVGDRVELLIPRSTANISLDGDSTYLGAVKLS